MTTLFASIAKLVLYIFLPGIVINLVQRIKWPFFAKTPAHPVREGETPKRRDGRTREPSLTPGTSTHWLETKWDTIIRSIALAFALYYFLLLLQPFLPMGQLNPFSMAVNPTSPDVFHGKDLFQLVDADYNAFSWQLRNAVRDYKKDRARKDATFDQHLQKQAEAVVPDEEDDNDRIVGEAPGGRKKRVVFDHLSPVEKIDHVYERVKQTENRKLYLLFGHETFIRCSWCIEEVDYFVFHFANVGLQYAIAACLLGLLTTARSRQGWRSIGGVVLLTLAASEALFYYLPSDYRNEIVHTFSPPPVLDQSIFFDDIVREHFVPVQQYLRMARYCALACLFLLIGLRKRGHEIPETLLLERIMKSQQQFFARFQALNAAEEAVQRDSQLRQRFADAQRRRRDEDDSFISSPSVQQALATAREKSDMSHIEADAAMAADDVVSLGQRIARARPEPSP